MQSFWIFRVIRWHGRSKNLLMRPISLIITNRSRNLWVWVFIKCFCKFWNLMMLSLCFGLLWIDLIHAPKCSTRKFWQFFFYTFFSNFKILKGSWISIALKCHCFIAIFQCFIYFIFYFIRHNETLYFFDETLISQGHRTKLSFLIFHRFRNDE